MIIILDLDLRGRMLKTGLWLLFQSRHQKIDINFFLVESILFDVSVDFSAMSIIDINRFEQQPRPIFWTFILLW